jgi:DNA primase
MARIPQSEIDHLNQTISLTNLVQSDGIELKKHGKDYLGLCPFHNDISPSLIISPDKNLWNCLGACSEGGTVVQWTMKLKDISFRHAVELLRGEVATKQVKSSDDTPKKTMNTQWASEQDNQILLKRVINYYHQVLKNNSEALPYLKDRGLLNNEMIDHFKLGFADRTLGYLLPQRGSIEGG